MSTCIKWGRRLHYYIKLYLKKWNNSLDIDEGHIQDIR